MRVAPTSSGGTAARRVPCALALLALWSLLAVVLTWPLARDASTHLPLTHFVASTDALVAAWVLAWQSHALASAPLLLPHGNIFHPSPYALLYGPMGTGALPLFAPVFLATGNAVLALSTTFLAGVVLTAWATSVVVLLWSGSLAAALVAGWTLLTSEWLMRGMVATAPFSAALFYLPVIAYLAARRMTRWRDALLLAPLIALQALVDLVYVAPAVLAPLAVLAVVRGARRGWSRSAPLVAALTIALLLMAPFVAGYVAVRIANPELAQQTSWRSAALALPLPGGLFARSSRALPAVLLATIACAAVSFVRRPVHERSPAQSALWLHGALWLGVGVLLSLPHTALLAGIEIPLPMGLVTRWLPGANVLRTPDRLGVAALLGGALLAGAALAEIDARLRALASCAQGGRVRWVRAALPAVLALGMYVVSAHAAPGKGIWLKPFPTFAPVRWSDQALEVLRAHPGPLLELPVPGRAASPPMQARAMLRSTDHWQPLLNGHHSYYPRSHADRMLLAALLPDRSALAALRDATGLSAIAVRLDEMLPVRRRVWEDLADAPPAELRLVHRAGDELIFVLAPRS